MNLKLKYIKKGGKSKGYEIKKKITYSKPLSYNMHYIEQYSNVNSNLN